MHHGRNKRSFARAASRNHRSSQLAKAVIEALEQRQLLADITVNTLQDVVDPNDRYTSLREAITLANGGGEDTIGFGSLTGTINLTSQLVLSDTDTTTIEGRAATLLSISGGDASRIFTISPNASVSISGITITAGYAADEAAGGGIYNQGALTLTNCTISGSSAGAGGAVFSSGGSLTLISSTIRDNSTYNGGGGGISVFGGTFNLNNSWIYQNTSSEEGAGVYIAGGTATITNSTISGNIAGSDGGAILNLGTLTITNSTIAGNTATVSMGGGICNYGGTLTAINTTVFGNSGSQGGGGIATTGGSLVLKNTIVAGNTGSPNVDGSYTGANNLTNGDPELGPLAENGGPTPTMRPLPGSPAIDAGNNSYAASLATDQRGLPRNVGGVDIGAYETGVNTTGATISATDGLTSFPEAVDFANTHVGEDTITFDPVVFTPGTLHTITIPLGVELTDDDTTTIRGPGQDILQLAGDSTWRVIDVYPGAAASISGLSVTDGFADYESGGGIRNQGTLELSNCKIWGNEAYVEGAGIFTNGGVLTVTNCTISDNSVTNQDGFGSGGGISSFDAQVTITNSTILDNSSPDGGGGIMQLAGSLALSNSEIAGNTAFAGGGVLVQAGTIIATNCTFTGNQAASGGGIRVSSWGNAYITNCTISGNTGSTGGGIHLDDASASSTLTNCTISDNTGIYGGGLTTTVALRVYNTIVAGNTATYYPNVWGSLHASSSNNLTSGNPLLGALADNGGPTQTMRPLPGSPTINGGSDSYATSLPTDQRGSYRFVGGVDIGAYETGVNTTSDVSNAGDHLTTLREALVYANSHSGADTITFDPQVFSPASLHTITLTQGQLVLSDTTGQTTIEGPGDDVLAISGNDVSRIFKIEAGASASISDMQVINGFVDDPNSGGDIYNAGALSVSRCTISDGWAYNHGGGIHSSGTLEVTDSTIANNYISEGEGAGISATASSTLTLRNCTISDNTASFNGAAIASDGANGTLTNCTITGNQGDFGAVQLRAGSVFSVHNCTISANVTNEAALYVHAGATLNLYNSIVSGNAGEPGTENLIGALNTNIGNLINHPTPMLGPLQNNGGLTDTMALLPGSPAIDAGNNSLMPTGVTTDQRGHNRIFNTTVDIGAYERDSATLTVQAVSFNRIDLSWDDISFGAASWWRIQRSETGAIGSFVNYADVSPGSQHYFYDDDGQPRILDSQTLECDVKQGKRYWYRVKPVGVTPEIEYSHKEFVTTPLPAPTALAVADDQSGASYITLTWNDAAEDEEGFHIYRSLNGVDGPFLLYETIEGAHEGPQPVVRAVGGLFPEMQYAFQVEAFTSQQTSSRVGPILADTSAVEVSAETPITDTTARLSVRANDPAGEATLSYEWFVSNAPAGAPQPQFSVNDSNAAKDTVATFFAAGSYGFYVAITNQSGHTITSDEVTVVAQQSATTITMAPGALSLNSTETKQFTATAFDQFGGRISATFKWSIKSVDQTWLTWQPGPFDLGRHNASYEPTPGRDPVSYSPYPSEAAGFGFGSIDSTGLYTAPVIGHGTVKVRATAGSATQTVDITVHEPLPDLWTWLETDSLAGTASGTQIDEWGDSSGQSINATQTVQSGQPTFATNAINGKPVVQFDGINDALELNGLATHIYDSFTIALVFRSLQGAGTSTNWWEGAGLFGADVPGVARDFGISLNQSGRVLAGTGDPDTSVYSPAGLNDGNAHLVTFRRDGQSGQITLYVDGAQVASGAGGTSGLNAPSILTIGSLQAAGTCFAGDIAEVQLYSQPLSDAQRQQLEARLLANYAIGSTNNQAPTIAVAGQASPSTVSGTTTTLTVTGADDDGESNLTYSWSVVSKPKGASPPTIHTNALHAAGTTDVTFTQAGTYVFRAKVFDAAGLAAVSDDVTVTVQQTPASIAITPRKMWFDSDTVYRWTVLSKPDVFDGPSFFPNLTNAAKTTTAVFYDEPGTYRIRVIATKVGFSGYHDFEVTVGGGEVNVPLACSDATIITDPAASVAAFETPEVWINPSTTFTWEAIPPGGGVPTPTLSFPAGVVNGTSGARDASATVAQAGEYKFRVTLFQGSLTADEKFDRVETIWATDSGTIHLRTAWNEPPWLNPPNTYAFTVIAADQFGHALSTQPTNLAWSIEGTALGQVSTDGVYTAADRITGSDIVRVATTIGPANLTSVVQVSIDALDHDYGNMAYRYPRADDFGAARTNFDYYTTEGVNAVVVQQTLGGDKILVGGSHTLLDDGDPGTPAPRQAFMLARYDARGQIDESFSSDGVTPAILTEWGTEVEPGSGEITDLVIQHVDGSDKILAVGTVTEYSGTEDSGEACGTTHGAIVRYNADGSLDGTFMDLDGPGAFDQDAHEGGDGQIYFGTWYPEDRSSAYHREFSAVAVDPATGRIVVASTGYSPNDPDESDRMPRMGFRWFEADGQKVVIDPPPPLPPYSPREGHFFWWQVNDVNYYSTDEATAIAVQADGKIIVAGRTTESTTGTARTHVAVMRRNADGTIDQTFGGRNGDEPGRVTFDFVVGEANEGAVAVAMQQTPDGEKIIVAGRSGDGFVARVNLDGTLDRNFGDLAPSGTRRNGTARLPLTFREINAIKGMIVRDDGRIFVSGLVNDLNDDSGTPQGGYFRLFSLTPDGQIDTTFSGGGILECVNSNWQMLSVYPAQLSDGRIVMAGTDMVNRNWYDGADADIIVAIGEFDNVAPALHNLPSAAVQIGEFDDEGNLDFSRFYWGVLLGASTWDDSGDDGSPVPPDATFDWSVIDKPQGANDPVFEDATDKWWLPPRAVFAHVYKAGDYRLRLTVTDSEGQTTVRDADVTVKSVDQNGWNNIGDGLTPSVVFPSAATLHNGETITLTAITLDQFADVPTQYPTGSWYQWRKEGAGLEPVVDETSSRRSRATYTAPTTGEAWGYVSAVDRSHEYQNYRGAWLYTPQNPPTVQQPPTVVDAVAGNVIKKTATLRVLGADDFDENLLTYTWSVIDKPAGTPEPQFTPFELYWRDEYTPLVKGNGTHNANGQDSNLPFRVRFFQAGDYVLRITITDPANQSVTSDLPITVAPTFRNISIDHPAAMLENGWKQQFSAVAEDQFGDELVPQPSSFIWSLEPDADAADGEIDSTGLYTAPSTGRGTDTIKAMVSGSTIFGINTISIPASGPDVVWLDDEFPAGATAPQSYPPAPAEWRWVEKAPRPHRGIRAHMALPEDMYTYSSGFRDATETLEVAPGNTLFVYVYLDERVEPDDEDFEQPTTLAVTWWAKHKVFDEDGEYVGEQTDDFTAYWSNSFTQQRSVPKFRYAEFPGLPTTRRWVRLEVPAAYMGLDEGEVSGMDFTQVPATQYAATRVIWDDAGIAPGVTAAPPQVETAASADPDEDVVFGSTLRVRGLDDGGEANLTYSWRATQLPEGAEQPSFSENESNAAKRTVATFSKAGDYKLTATISDKLGQSVTSDRWVEVAQYPTSIELVPSAPEPLPAVTLGAGENQEFHVVVRDQFGDEIAEPDISWSWSEQFGSLNVSQNGDSAIYTAPDPVAEPRNLSIGATAQGGFSPSVATWVRVTDQQNEDPQVAQEPTYTEATDTTVELSVLGIDDGGEENLVYEWSAIDSPAGSDPQFSPNDTNDAKNTSVTLDCAGSYTFHMTITDQGNRSVTRDIYYYRSQIFTYLAVDPAAVSIDSGQTFPVSQQFQAVAQDQFYHAMESSQPSPLDVEWSVDAASHGSITSPGGVYTAPASGDYTDIVIARWQDEEEQEWIATAEVVVGNGSPEPVIQPLTAPSNVTGTSVDLSVSATGGDGPLTYHWEVVPGDPAAAEPSFGDNNSATAADTTLTFFKAGQYTVSVTVKDSRGRSFDDAGQVTIQVNKTPTAIRISPPSAVLKNDETQHFTAAVVDQFDDEMAAEDQPTFTWSVVNGGVGGSIGSVGTYQAPASGQGNDTITVAGDSLNATATVTISTAPTEWIAPRDGSSEFPFDPPIGPDPAANSVSGAVRYFDGTANYSSTDFDSAEGGIISGHTRTWSSEFAGKAATSGSGWAVSQWPYLEKAGTSILARAGHSATWFDFDGATYSPRFASDAKLDKSGSQFILTDGSGNKAYYPDFVGATTITRIDRLIDAGGNETKFDTPHGAVSQIERKRGTATVLERLTYAYKKDGVLSGLIESVTMERLVATALQPVQRASYEYYDSPTAYGKAGDLKRVTIELWNGTAWVPTDHKLYRYEPATGRLLVVLEGDSYERLAASGDPADASPTDIAKHANLLLTYDVGSGKLSNQTIQGGGTYAYQYEPTSGLTDDYNAWKYKTIEYLPDSTPADLTNNDRNVIYTNYLGEVILEEFLPCESTSGWRHVYEYDDDGQLVRETEPSAVDSAPLLEINAVPAAVRTDAGLIHEYSYFSAADLDSGVNGAAPGHLRETAIRRGSAGSLVPLVQYQYVRPSLTSNVWLVSGQTAHRKSDSLQPVLTRYQYTFEGDQVTSRTTTLPMVGTAQNGNNSTTVATIERFHSFGRAVWLKDADGFLHFTQYDDATGAVIKTIDDVRSSIITPPANWKTPTGGGLHLTTTLTVDGLGRTRTIIEPNQQSVAPQSQKKTTIEYLDTAAVREVRTIPPTTGAGVSPPMEVIRTDRSTGTIYMFTVVRGGTALRSLSRSIYNESNQLVMSDRFYDVANITYSGGSLTGVSGANAYYRIEYHYDDRGRQDRGSISDTSGPADPTPGITRTVYDSLDRPIATWLGTDDVGWTPSATSHSNMVRVSESQYDNGGVGDGNLTRTTAYTTSNADKTKARVTQMWYDWRDRLVASKAGVKLDAAGNPATEDADTNRPLTYYEYDNLDRVLVASVYDGDTIALGADANSDGVPDKPVDHLRAKTATFFDDRGQVYRTLQHGVNQLNGDVANGGLASDAWYDNRGNVIKTRQPGGLVTKTRYDGSGRPIVQSVTDGGGDPAPGAQDSAPASLKDDIVLEETEYVYDENGNVLLNITKQRNHNSTVRGAASSSGLDSANSRASLTANWYDIVNRLVTTVNYGNAGNNGNTTPNDGSSAIDFVRPAAPLARDDQAVNGWDRWLRTDHEYDDAGRLFMTTNPRGIKTRTFYDALDRTTAVVEAYTGTPSVTNPDTLVVETDANRYTKYTYNGLDQVLTETAVTYRPPPGDPPPSYPPNVPLDGGTPADRRPSTQTTTYTYGVVKGGDIAINDNSLLAEIEYELLDSPPGGMSQDAVTFNGYNALGELTKKTDRDGSVHAYSFDSVGRLTQDLWSDTAAFASGKISTYVDRLQYTYDALGRGVTFTSKSGTTVKNEVKREYDGLGHLQFERQSHDGAVNGTTPTVEYVYDTNYSDNYSRLRLLKYPSGRSITYVYGYNGVQGTASTAWLSTLNDRISRVGYIADGSFAAGATVPNSARLETYDYLGVSRWVVRDYPNAVNSNGVNANIGVSYLSDALSPGDTTIGKDDAGPTDLYNGLDRFGRVVDHGWYGDARRHYAYDADGNMLYAREGRTFIDYAWRSDLYHLNSPEDANGNPTFDPANNGNNAYDRLGRMKGYLRGQLNYAVGTVPASTSVSQENLIAYTGGPAVPTQYLAAETWKVDANGGFSNADAVQARANLPHAYQKPTPSAGNTSAPSGTLPNELPRRDLFVMYDAWGRLVEQGEASLTKSGSTWKYERPFKKNYAYDALGRRISETYTDRSNRTGTIHLYVDPTGNVLEERDPERPTNSQTTHQYIYSAAAAGMMVARDTDANADGAMDQRIWVEQGPDGSVWAIRLQGGSSLEKEEFLYSPDGQVQATRWNGTLQYSFVPNSMYDWRYYWRGGRAALDQDISDPANNSGGFIEKFNQLVYLNGQEYDTTSGSPLKQDVYAYYRNDREHSTRSSLIQYDRKAGTSLPWQDVEFNTQMMGVQATMMAGALTVGAAGGLMGLTAAAGLSVNNLVNGNGLHYIGGGDWYDPKMQYYTPPAWEKPIVQAMTVTSHAAFAAATFGTYTMALGLARGAVTYAATAAAGATAGMGYSYATGGSVGMGALAGAEIATGIGAFSPRLTARAVESTAAAAMRAGRAAGRGAASFAEGVADTFETLAGGGMRMVPTRMGAVRSNTSAWRALRDSWDTGGYGEILSATNRKLIAQGRAPVVDDAWIGAFPGDAGRLGEQIRMHHVGGYPLSVPLTESAHLQAHMPGGFRYNPGGPGIGG